MALSPSLVFDFPNVAVLPRHLVLAGLMPRPRRIPCHRFALPSFWGDMLGMSWGPVNTVATSESIVNHLVEESQG